MFLLNTLPARRQPLDDTARSVFGPTAPDTVLTFLRHCPGYRPTPLLSQPRLAHLHRVGQVLVKDESARLGLGSFKALGGAYAVLRLALTRASGVAGRQLAPPDLMLPEHRAAFARMTVACATDGNHGRSVAAGARLAGCRAVIFVHAGVSDERVAAIARFGAEIIRIDGSYDDSVRASLAACSERGWTLVSDTSWPGYEEVPALVMQGYTVIVREILDALDEPPTHVFLQAGVGGLAAAVAAHWTLAGPKSPAFIVVEPERAACLHASAAAGQPVVLDPGQATVMAMLECYEPSLVAWRILERTASAFMAVREEDAIAAMRALATADRPIVGGESGAAGLAGLARASSDPDMRAALRLDRHSRVLVINTEGATDVARYKELAGLDPATIGMETA